jgi:mRNA-degrading endonuclease toxin of MazEF toxin-antitoxin module
MSKFPQEGEIWLVKFEKLKESRKPYRPCLVISDNIQNEFDEEIIVAPLSTKDLDQIEPYQVFIKISKQNGLKEDSKILLHRLRSIERETRLGDYCGAVSPETMLKVKYSLKLVLDWDD